MKSLKSTLVTTLLMFLSLNFILRIGTAQTPGGQKGAVIRIGVSPQGFGELNRNDVAAALKVWAAAVVKEHNLDEQAEVTVFDRFEDLRIAFRQDRLEAVAITVEELMLLGVEPDPVLLPVTEQGIYVRYAILVHRDGGITDIAGLTNRKLVMHKGQRMIFAAQWLNTVLAGHDKPVVLRPGDQTLVENPSKAILQVYFRQSQAALTTTDAFELACELNPQLRKEIKVLTISQPLILTCLIFRPTFQGRTRETIEGAISELHTTPGGRQVLTVFQSSRMEKQPASILEPTRQFLNEYQRLLKKSGS